MSDLSVCVLFRASKKSGKIDTTMTGMGSALMRMWALKNTPKTKMCMIFERESGKLIFATYGQDSGFPKVTKESECKGTCDDWGIPLSALHEITDERFDNAEV